MTEINVENIILDLKAKAREKAYKQPLKSFDEIVLFESNENFHNEPFDIDFMLKSVLKANECYYIEPEIPIAGRKSFIKKIVKKLIGFYIKPIVIKNNEFNTYAIRSINQLRNYIYENYEYYELMKKIDFTVNTELKKSYEITNNKIDILNRKIQQLEELYEKLSKEIKN